MNRVLLFTSRSPTETHAEIQRLESDYLKQFRQRNRGEFYISTWGSTPTEYGATFYWDESQREEAEWFVENVTPVATAA